MSYQNRSIHPNYPRLDELLQAVKVEFENVTQEAVNFRTHQDDYDQKFQHQTHEMQQVRQMVFELELAHRNMKERYEEEIRALQRQLEASQQQQVPQQQVAVNPANNGQIEGQHPPAHVLSAQQHQHAPQVGINQQVATQPAQPAYQPSQLPPPPGASYNVPQVGAGVKPEERKELVALQQAPAAQQIQPAPQQQQPHQQQIPPPQAGADPMAEAIALGNNLGDLDIEKVAPEFKKVKDDWFVIYNERAPRLLDVELVQSLDHVSVVCCVRFSSDGKYIATGCNRSAQIFDVSTGQRICTLQDDKAEREGDLYIRSVCFSPDGQYLATGAEDKQIRVWDIPSRTIKYVFTGHEQDIYSLDFSRNGRYIASGSGDRTVRMWDMKTANCILTLSIEDGVTTVALSPDGRYVAAGSLDKTVRVWDTSTGFLVERLEPPEGHSNSVYSVVFSPDGKDLVSGSLDKTIKLWELQAPRGVQATHKGGVCVKTFTGHKDFVLSVATTPDSKWILSGSKDRGVQFWDPQTAQVQLLLQGHKNSVIGVAPSPTESLFATGSGDCRARIWRYYPATRQ